MISMRLLILLLVSAAAVLPQTGGGGGASSQLPSGTSMPRVIQRTEPEYTKDALDAKLEGTVILSTTITVDGIASEIHIVKPLGLGLDEKAVECIEKWRFSPGMRNGLAIPTRAQVEIRFKLPSLN